MARCAQLLWSSCTSMQPHMGQSFTSGAYSCWGRTAANSTRHSSSTLLATKRVPERAVRCTHPDGSVWVGTHLAQTAPQLGMMVTTTLAVHNVPEGFAVSTVLVAKGMSVWGAALWSIFTSIPQPIMAIAAYRFVDAFVLIQVPDSCSVDTGHLQALRWRRPALGRACTGAYNTPPPPVVLLSCTQALLLPVAYPVVARLFATADMATCIPV